MNENFMHGLVAIVFLCVMLYTVPMAYRTVSGQPWRTWWSNQTFLFAAGIAIDSAGVVLISGYRTFQIWLHTSGGLADVWTNVSLALLAIGGSLVVRAGSLGSKAPWKLRIYLVAVLSWVVVAALLPL